MPSLMALLKYGHVGLNGWRPEDQGCVVRAYINPLRYEREVRFLLTPLEVIRVFRVISLVTGGVHDTQTRRRSG